MYKVTNCINGLVYVGQTSKTLIERKNKHLQDSFYDRGHKFSDAIRKFGIENFIFETLILSDDSDELDFFERYYIKQYNTNISKGGIGYNLTAGGQGTSGYKWTDVSRAKIRRPLPISKDELLYMANTMTLQEIATKFNVACCSVNGWLKDCGIKKPRIQRVVNNQNKGSWTIEAENQLFELYEKGLSFEEIASVLNRTVAAISIKFARLRRKRGLVGSTRRRRNQHMKIFQWELK